MPTSRAEVTTDHAASETAPLGPKLPGHDDLRGHVGDAGPRPNGSGPAIDATTDHEDVGPDGGGDGGHDLRHERFQIGAVLGEGGMGVVYRARDTRDGRDVALKLMKGSLAGTARRRFEREFRSLATLHHPHCLNVFDYGELDRGPFFTMELFQGRPITCLAGRGVDAVLDPLLQVTLALDYIHNQGIVHRDVKPSNILVRPATGRDGQPGFEAKLMDFGLAKYYGVKSSLSAEAGFVGTVAYCAPEQLNNDELDHRADLYCLGLVSYELLSGRYPFPQARLDGMRPLMRAQLSEKPRSLAEISPDVPGPIADAVMRYLRKEPRRRPDSGGLLRNAIAAHLGIDDQTAVYAGSLTPARPMLSVVGFVCRSHELEALDDVLCRCLGPADFDDSTAGLEVPPSLIVVSGEPGIGKSSVVQEAERIARGHGCQVYEGRCFDGNLAPFQPFVEIIRQLIAELRLQERREAAAPDLDLTGTHVAGLPAESAARLLAIVSDYRGELLRIAPDLQKYLPGEVYRQSDFGREADYIYRALSAFFVELATLQPICLSFEDLQWADKSSLDLLRHLAMALDQARKAAAGTPAASPRLVMIASARTEYAQVDPFLAPLRDQNKVMELALAPLTEAETRDLIALRLNCRPEELAADLVARVHDLCGGNPFFVSETIREWFEKAAITRSESGWVLLTLDADASDLPQTVRDAMRIRIEGLPAKTQQVFGAAAVIGAVVDIDLLRDALPDLTETEVLDAVDALLPRRVFRETGNADRVEFVHDLLRELPYGDLSASRRRVLHRRIGELLERRRTQGKAVTAAVLADHFRNAEDGPKAFAYSLEAAQAALDAYAFNNAITHLKHAQALAPNDANGATLYELWEKFGVAYGASGQLDDAIIAHQKAAEYAVDDLRRASANYGVGEAYHRKGGLEAAKRHLNLTLRDVGYSRPQSLPGRMFDMWRSSVAFHVVPAQFMNLGRDPRSEEKMALAFDAYRRICQITGQLNVFDYTHSSYRLALFSKRSRDPEIAAAGYSKIGLNCGMFGLTWLGKNFIKRAEKAAYSCTRADVLATVKAHLGASFYFEGKLEEAETSLREAALTLDKVGDWFGMFTHHLLRHIYSVRGDIPRALAEAETEIEIAVRRGDSDTLAWGQYGKADALARAGRIQEAQEFATMAVESAIARNATTVTVAQSVLGYVRLQASDYAGARQALEQSRARAIRTMFLCEFMAPTFPMLVESLLGPHWHNPANGLSRAIVRKAWRESRVARFACTSYVNYYPHALRVSGRAAWALGKKSAAVRYFERSIAAAEKLGARYDVARGYLDIARVVPERSDEYRRRGQSLLDELGAVVPEAER